MVDSVFKSALETKIHVKPKNSYRVLFTHIQMKDSRPTSGRQYIIYILNIESPTKGIVCIWLEKSDGSVAFVYIHFAMLECIFFLNKTY